MITFLPDPDFGRSALCLDPKRLGKQRLEAQQILDVLLAAERSRDLRGGRPDDPVRVGRLLALTHPACAMWVGYEPALEVYLTYVINEWIRRGYESVRWTGSTTIPLLTPNQLPWWLGDPRVHGRHRRVLKGKDPAYYRRFRWPETALTAPSRMDGDVSQAGGVTAEVAGSLYHWPRGRGREDEWILSATGGDP